MDDLTLSLIVALVATVAFGGLFLAMARLDARDRAGRLALAERRGLLFEEIPAQGGRAGRYVFTDTARGLVLDITRPRRSGKSSSDGHSVLRLSQPRLQDGLAVWASGLPVGMGAQMAQLGGMLEMGLVQMLLRKVLGDEIAPHLPHLRDVALPEGTGLVLLASTDPALLPPAASIAAALAALPPNGGAPNLAMLGTGGMSLRMTKAVLDPAKIEAVLDAGLALREALR